MPKVLGFSATQLPDRYTFDKEYGWRLIQAFQGTEQAVDGLHVTLANDVAVRRINRYGLGDGTFIIEAEYNSDGTSASQTLEFSTWELLGNEEQPDIRQLNKFRSLTNGQLLAVQVGVDNPDEEATFAVDEQDELYELLLRGADTYIASKYVLSHTKVVASSYSSKVSFTDVLSVYTTTQLNNEQNAVGTPIPNTILFSIGDIPAQSPPAPYIWGWLKKTPTVQNAGGNVFQIVQEWWLDAWPTTVYPAKS